VLVLVVRGLAPLVVQVHTVVVVWVVFSIVAAV
jgi:hypothetical protein